MEHIAHICHVAYIPMAYVLVEWSCFPKHVNHVFHCRKVRGIISDDFQVATSCERSHHTCPPNVSPLLDRQYFVWSIGIIWPLRIIWKTIKINMRKISGNFYLVLACFGIRVGRIFGLASIKISIAPINGVVVRTTFIANAIDGSRDGNWFVIRCCLPDSDKRSCVIVTIRIEVVSGDGPFPIDEHCSGSFGRWTIGPTVGSQLDISYTRIIYPSNQGCRIVGAIQAWAIEHVLSSDSIRFPVSQVLIEWSRIHKHSIHVCYTAYIPITYILIESSSSFEHGRHVFYITYIPMAYVLVEWKSILEHLLHACDRRQIEGIWCVDFQVATSPKSPFHTCPLGISPLLHTLYFISPFTPIKINVRKISGDFHLVRSCGSIGVGHISGLVNIRSSITPIDGVVVRATAAIGGDGNWFIIHYCFPDSGKRPCFTTWIGDISGDGPTPTFKCVPSFSGMWTIGPAGSP